VNACQSGRDNLKEISMNTNRTKTPMRRQITAGVLLAGAIAAGGLGAAATAGARPPINPVPVPVQPRPASGTLVASIAYSPETGVWAAWTNAPSWQNADFAALNLCQDRDGTHCLVTQRVGNNYNQNQCVALAVDAIDWTHWHNGVGPTVVSAETAALQGPNSRIATVACTTTNGSPVGTSGHVDRPQWS
jgi:hypothetical protein